MGDQEDLSTRFAEIDISTTDFGALLSSLAVVEQRARLYRGKFRMPRVLFAVVPIDPATGGTGGPVVIQDPGDSTLKLDVLSASEGTGDSQNIFNGAVSGLPVLSFPMLFDGGVTAWSRMRHAVAVTSIVDAAAGTTSVVAAGGVGKKTRIFAATLSLANGSTASKATLNDGANILSLQGGIAATATSPDTVSLNYGPDGIPQPTTNAAISIIVTGTGALGAATVVTGTAE